MKKIIIKLGNKLFIPVAFLGGCSLVFEKELVNFPCIFYIRCFIVLLAAILVLSALLQIFDSSSNKK